MKLVGPGSAAPFLALERSGDTAESTRPPVLGSGHRGPGHYRRRRLPVRLVQMTPLNLIRARRSTALRCAIWYTTWVIVRDRASALDPVRYMCTLLTNTAWSQRPARVQLTLEHLAERRAVHARTRPMGQSRAPCRYATLHDSSVMPCTRAETL